MKQLNRIIHYNTTKTKDAMENGEISRKQVVLHCAKWSACYQDKGKQKERSRARSQDGDGSGNKKST